MLKALGLEILVATALVFASTAHAASDPAPKEDAHAAPAAKAHTDGKKDAAAAKSSIKSNVYVHQWIPMPSVAGTRLGSASIGEVGASEAAQITPRKGRATVVVFMASWCERCQQLTPDLLKLVTRYKKLDVDFHYVFKNDTRDDAEGFMKEFGIGLGVLSTFDVQKAYNDPPLPSIYVGDRHGWMASRYLETTPDDLATLDELLRNITAL